MKYLIVLAIALFGAVAAKEYDRPCRFTTVSPNVKTGFSVASYLGAWYEISRYDEALWTLDCVMARYNLQADGSVQVLNSGYAPNGTFIDFVGRAVPSFPNQTPLPAKLDVVFFPDQEPAPYWVLSTDYTNYAIVWSCLNLPNGRSRELGWVLSRESRLNAAADARVEQVLRDNDLDRSFMRNTPQDLVSCRAGRPNE